MKRYLRITLTLIMMVSSLLWAGNQEQPSLAILPLNDAVGKKASSALLEALNTTKKITGIPLSKIEASMGNRTGSNANATISKAQKNLDAGRVAYDALDFKKAQNLLSSAKMQFRSLSHQEEAFEGLRSAQIQLALLYLANKQTELAKKELTDMYIADPERESRSLSKKQYTPAIIKLYEDIQENYKGKLNAALVIETDPEGAIVYLDGKMLGPSPASLMRLPQGTHSVFVSLEGFKGQSIDKAVVAGNNELSVTLAKQADDGAPKFSPVKNKDELDHTQVAFLEALATKTKADIFVFLKPGNGEILAQLYDQRSQEVSKIVVGKSPEELAKKLVAQTNSSGYVVAASDEAQEEESSPQNTIVNPKIRESQLALAKANEPTPKQYSDKASIWSSPWLWGTIGAVALVGVGGYFAYDKYLKTETTTTLTLPIPGR